MILVVVISSISYSFALWLIDGRTSWTCVNQQCGSSAMWFRRRIGGRTKKHTRVCDVTTVAQSARCSKYLSQVDSAASLFCTLTSVV